MRTPLHPAGILIAHALPMVVLAVLYGSVLQVVHPLLAPESIAAWERLALIAGAGTLGAAGYAAVQWFRRAPTHPLYAVLVFIAYVPLLFHIGSRMSVLFPIDVPRWMMPENAELYAFRLISLPLAHALFVLVAASLPVGHRGRPLRDLLAAAAIPLLVYLFVQVVVPLRRSSDFEEHAWAVVLVCLTIVFLFLVVRGIMALTRRSRSSETLRMVATVMVALVLPLLGLMVNNGDIPGPGRYIGHVFGNLAHPAFYIIAVLNAAVLIWPSSERPGIRLLQFVLRSAGFTYTLYFLVLFLPFLPLSIVAIVAFGLGFLLLAPILLFALQATVLIADARFLATHRSWPAIAVSAIASMAVIPAAIGMRYLHHRMVLRDALHHVFASDLSLFTQPLDEEVVAEVLAQVDANRSRRDWNNRNTPFLTPLYNRIVLDNLTLSEQKADLLERILLDAPVPDEGFDMRGMQRVMPPSANTAISWCGAASVYDHEAQAWRSRVHLRVSNTGGEREEFVRRFALPDGAWVNGHYLVIAGDTVPGILAEEKAASWVYANIVSYRQDPSLMRRTPSHAIELRVFPVEPHELRSTGFDVLHKEAFDLVLGSDTLRLGDDAHALPPQPLQGAAGTAYIPRSLKADLPRIERAPHHHFVVDGSEAQRARRGAVIARLSAFVAREQIDPARITLHIADAYGRSLAYGPEALDAYAHHVGHGGFFSDRVIRKVLSEAVLNPAPSFPLVVIVPSEAAQADHGAGILLEDLPSIAASLPEGDRFLVLHPDGSLSQRRFDAPGADLSYSALEPRPVRAWPDTQQTRFYLRDDGEGEIIVDMPHLTDGEDAAQPVWEQAMALEGRYRAYALRYDGGRIPWLNIVRGSFTQQVLMPVTAWMCVENEAQRNALRRKQEETLASDASLDTMDQELTSMREPSWWWLTPMLLLVLIGRPMRR
ncbi:MAG: MSEP-CTERM sorting domain-containing protein [Flavobacteriales bacterium]|nr:MSEP-CTERM sorting domain-containing protein [Flavobacteriales bacterium]